MERLMRFAPPGGMEDWEYPIIQSAIDDLRGKGWEDCEILCKLRWVEHVNPTVAEDVALRNMREMDERVALRLATIKR
jgi:hypothetical protein